MKFLHREARCEFTEASGDTHFTCSVTGDLLLSLSQFVGDFTQGIASSAIECLFWP